MSAQPSTEPTPTMQDHYLAILRGSRCNSLNGERVAADLLAHRDLWLSAYPLRESGSEEVTLRDLVDDSHDVDTLYLLCTKDNVTALDELARDWSADEFDANPVKYAQPDRVIVRLWWD